MNLLEQIGIDLIDQPSQLTNTLRKAQMLAHQLNVPELGDWVKLELEGYQNDDVPEYRHLQLPVYGTFPGPMGLGTQTVNISSKLPQQIRDNVQDLPVTYKIAVLEELMASNETESHRTLAEELTDILRQALAMDERTMLIESYQEVPHVFFAGILDSVRNRLLSFVLDLQDMNATPEALRDGSIAPEAVRNSFNINITNSSNNIIALGENVDDVVATVGDIDVERVAYNINITNSSNNIIALGENVDQTVSIVQKGDVNSLLHYLRTQNVSQQDLDDLRIAVGAEPHAANGSFGPRVRAWLGTMVSKAVSGLWQAGAVDASTMLVGALRQYYGG